jgi:hypothetical protein
VQGREVLGDAVRKGLADARHDEGFGAWDGVEEGGVRRKRRAHNGRSSGENETSDENE